MHYQAGASLESRSNLAGPSNVFTLDEQNHFPKPLSFSPSLNFNFTIRLLFFAGFFSFLIATPLAFAAPGFPLSRSALACLLRLGSPPSATPSALRLRSILSLGLDAPCGKLRRRSGRRRNLTIFDFLILIFGVADRGLEDVAKGLLVM